MIHLCFRSDTYIFAMSDVWDLITNRGYELDLFGLVLLEIVSFCIWIASSYPMYRAIFFYNILDTI